MAGSILLPHGAGEDAQGDREQGVTDRRDALQVEHQRVEPARRRSGSPGSNHQDIPSPYPAATTSVAAPTSAELDQRPVSAADALGPHQAVRAVLELPGDQRGAPEQADQQRQEDEQDGDERTGLNSLLNWLRAASHGLAVAGHQLAVAQLRAGSRAARGRRRRGASLDRSGSSARRARRARSRRRALACGCAARSARSCGHPPLGVAALGVALGEVGQDEVFQASPRGRSSPDR